MEARLRLSGRTVGSRSRAMRLVTACSSSLDVFPMTPYTLHWAPHVTSPIEWVKCVLEVRLRGNTLFGCTESQRPEKVVEKVTCGINLCFIVWKSQWYIHWRCALILARLTQLKMVIKLTLQWQQLWVTYIYESWHNLIRSLCLLYEATFQRVGNVWHINLFLKLIWLGLPRLWHCVLNRHSMIKSYKSHLFNHLNLFIDTSHVHNEQQDILMVAWLLFAVCWVAPPT